MCVYFCISNKWYDFILLFQRHAKMDIRASNNIVHLWTCADSCFALTELINYLSKDGDIVGESQLTADRTATPVCLSAEYYVVWSFQVISHGRRRLNRRSDLLFGLTLIILINISFLFLLFLLLFVIVLYKSVVFSAASVFTPATSCCRYDTLQPPSTATPCAGAFVAPGLYSLRTGDPASSME